MYFSNIQNYFNMANEEKTFPTQEQIENWKQKHSIVRQVSVPLGDDLVVDGNGDEASAVFIIGSPSRQVVYAMQTAIEKGDKKKADDILMANCVRFGDKQLLKENDDVFFAVSKAIADITATKQVEVKNL